MTEYVWYDFISDEIIVNFVDEEGINFFGESMFDWGIYLGEL